MAKKRVKPPIHAHIPLLCLTTQLRPPIHPALTPSIFRHDHQSLQDQNQQSPSSQESLRQASSPTRASPPPRRTRCRGRGCRKDEPSRNSQHAQVPREGDEVPRGLPVSPGHQKFSIVRILPGADDFLCLPLRACPDLYPQMWLEKVGVRIPDPSRRDTSSARSRKALRRCPRSQGGKFPRSNF